MEQITDVLDNFDNALNNAIVLDNQIFVDGNKISANYSDLLSISTRQVMGAIDFTVGYDSAGNWNTSDVMAFLRNAAGIGSGGCVFFFGSSLYLMLTVSCIYLQDQSEHCGCHLCRLANILVPQSEYPRVSVETTFGVSRKQYVYQSVCSYTHWWGSVQTWLRAWTEWLPEGTRY